MRLVIIPQSEDEMHDWEAKGESLLPEVQEEISAFNSSQLKFSLRDSEFGIGASWPSIF